MKNYAIVKSFIALTSSFPLSNTQFPISLLTNNTIEAPSNKYDVLHSTDPVHR